MNYDFASQTARSLTSRLKISALNCQKLKDKVDQTNFLKLVSKMDIFGVSETWLKKNNEDINLPGFKFYPASRKNISGAARGGVGVFIKTEIKIMLKLDTIYLVKTFYGAKSQKISWVIVMIYTYA